jgi:hypothetical protein
LLVCERTGRSTPSRAAPQENQIYIPSVVLPAGKACAEDNKRALRGNAKSRITCVRAGVSGRTETPVR